MASKYIGIDLFSGAGGMSVGAARVGVDIKMAVEMDKYAALTFKANHPTAALFNDDIRKWDPRRDRTNSVKILFGGPPCQGFSSSNQKTRNSIINPFETKNAILEQANKHAGHNIVISPMNNKISTISCALASFENYDIQLAIAIPAVYNYENYSKPSDCCHILDIDGIIKHSNVL